jgi:hypothetical protein
MVLFKTELLRVNWQEDITGGLKTLPMLASLSFNRESATARGGLS